MDHSADNLLDRLRRNGCRSDWERFVDLYSPLLEHWARRLAPSGEAADLVQDVLLRVMLQLPSFTGEGDRSFLAWLREVMLNRWRDLCRRAAVRPCAGDPAALAAIAEDDGLHAITTADDRQIL